MPGFLLASRRLPANNEDRPLGASVIGSSLAGASASSPSGLLLPLSDEASCEDSDTSVEEASVDAAPDSDDCEKIRFKISTCEFILNNIL